MKKISVNGALMVIAILTSFCVEAVWVRLGLTAAAGLFFYLLAEQIGKNEEEKKQQGFLRLEELFRDQQAELGDALQEIALTLKGLDKRILAMEEKGDESLKTWSRENAETINRLTQQTMEAMEQLGEKADGMANQAIQAAEQLAKKGADTADQMIQAMERQGEKTSAKVDQAAQAIKLLAEKGEEMGSLLEREERCCVTVAEQVKIMEALGERTFQKMQTLAEDHYNKMSDLFDDQNDNLDDFLNSMKKEQLRPLREYNERMNSNLKELNQAVLSGITPVLGQNQELLQYVQEVQKEWTSLDKKELDFLSKVWEGR